jgi:hypothetical protein
MICEYSIIYMYVCMYVCNIYESSNKCNKWKKKKHIILKKNNEYLFSMNKKKNLSYFYIFLNKSYEEVI